MRNRTQVNQMAEDAIDEELKYENSVTAALKSDETLLGEIWRYESENGRVNVKTTRDGVRPRKTSSFVYTYWPIIDAITIRKVPDKPLAAGRIVKPLESFKKRHRKILNSGAVQILNETIDHCSQIAENEKLKEREDAEATKNTEEYIEVLQNHKISGIYVYTYPHYRRHAVKEGSDNSVERTLYKIGRTSNDIKDRVYQQTRTHVPESPILVRMYISHDSTKLKNLESDFHDIVNAAHPYERGVGVGDEWFLTDLELLDVIAEQKGLEIRKRDSDDLELS